MVEHKWVAVVDDPEAMAIGPVDTAEEAGDLGHTYGEDDQYRVYPLVAPDDAADYEPPLLVRPGKEPVLREEFKDGDRVQPIGWAGSGPKPAGVIVGSEYENPLTGRKVVMVRWDGVSETRHLAPAVLERVAGA